MVLKKLNLSLFVSTTTSQFAAMSIVTNVRLATLLSGYRVNNLTKQRHIFTTSPVAWIQKQTRVRVVDNSKIGREAMTEGKKVKCIHVYKKNNKVKDGQLGDRVLVTIKGQMKRAYVVGLVAEQRPMVPKFDTNNVVLIENNGNPTATRVVVPVPNFLRSKGPELAKIIAISSRFT